MTLLISPPVFSQIVAAEATDDHNKLNRLNHIGDTENLLSQFHKSLQFNTSIGYSKKGASARSVHLPPLQQIIESLAFDDSSDDFFSHIRSFRNFDSVEAFGIYEGIKLKDLKLEFKDVFDIEIERFTISDIIKEIKRLAFSYSKCPNAETLDRLNVYKKVLVYISYRSCREGIKRHFLQKKLLWQSITFDGLFLFKRFSQYLLFTSGDDEDASGFITQVRERVLIPLVIHQNEKFTRSNKADNRRQ